MSVIQLGRLDALNEMPTNAMHSDKGTELHLFHRISNAIERQS